MIDFFLVVVEAVWHFMFYMGKYVNHTLGKVIVGIIIFLFGAVVTFALLYHFVFLSGYMLMVKIQLDKRYQQAGYAKWHVISTKYKEIYPRTYPFMYCLRHFTHWAGKDLLCDKLTFGDGTTIYFKDTFVPQTVFPVIQPINKDESK